MNSAITIDSRILEEAANAALEYGLYYSPEKEPLKDAVAWFRLLGRQEDTDAAKRAKWNNQIGDALINLADREDNTSSLEEAVKAYRSAIEEYTISPAPLDWAMTQNNLGDALRYLGDRENNTARLE